MSSVKEIATDSESSTGSYYLCPNMLADKITPEQIIKSKVLNLPTA